MVTHLQVWTALDGLAGRAGLTPSGLAKKAALDPTTFNKSKRRAAARADHQPNRSPRCRSAT